MAYRFSLCVFLLFLAAPAVNGQVVSFDWTASDSISGTGHALGIDATYRIQQGADKRVYDVENPTFADKYTDSLIGFEIGQDIISGTGAFTFSSPLPAGSILFFQDLDSAEAVAMESNVRLELIENIERYNDSSDPASYNSVTQTVSSLSGSVSNGGVVVFDAEGLTSLAFALSMPNSGSAGMGFAIAAVPEPSAAILLSPAMLGLILRRRRR